ncbi:helix-turn-helix domain-containing protein [Xanthomonas populi]|uniref:Uncharacterized protein n=1 Tax=Xanthomonas populi TaxID=53414 RepID=A0A2S7F4A8_9XANT|nr:helix-turn-helix domain-containing protein [Xanthomonas populi]PPV00167.1 hypothetical protein XpopCFBP1817_01535 [Xanthomonas populi]
MDKEGARHHTLDRLHERRTQGVRLHRLGHGVMQIVKLTGLSSPTVRRAIDDDASGGLAGIKPSRPGRAAGQGRALSPAQEASIQQIICKTSLGRINCLPPQRRPMAPVGSCWTAHIPPDNCNDVGTV